MRRTVVVLVVLIWNALGLGGWREVPCFPAEPFEYCTFLPVEGVSDLVVRGQNLLLVSPGQASLWDLIVRRELFSVRPSPGWAGFWSGNLSPDGRFLAVSAFTYVFLWDAVTGELLRVFEHHRWPVMHVIFHPTGSTLVSAALDGTIIIWDIHTGAELGRITGYYPLLAPDGQRILVSTWFEKGPIRLVDVESGKELMVLPIHGIPWAFTPDARFLLISVGNVLEIWNLEGRERVRALTGFTKDITAVAISPDGSRVAAGSLEYAIRVWDIGTGEIVATMDLWKLAPPLRPEEEWGWEESGQRVLDLSFLDENTLVSGSMRLNVARGGPPWPETLIHVWSLPR